MSILRKRTNQQIFCEAYDDKKLKDHRQARNNFLKTEEDLLRSELKGIKKTLAINKEIIMVLTKQQANQALAKLNEENIYLLNQIKLLKKQRDTYHKKSFIAEQIIAELRYKARDDFKDYKDTAINFIDELDSKEYVIQNLQYKYDRLEETVRKYARQDTELAAMLKEHDADRLRQSRRITSVVNENKRLGQELAKAKKRIRELEQRLRRGKANCSVIVERNDLNPILAAKDERSRSLAKVERSPKHRLGTDAVDDEWIESIFNCKLSSQSTSKDSTLELEMGIEKCDVSSDDDYGDILILMKAKSSP
eukprot:TRINITY_DN4557_c0_g4_i2.p1 TRINITY_DN4557_c0_g4~~TRINITY_DN4557_c0_g4_i2.p1  ORF type:complete len:308 (+),score=85.93 TRINITY_DN4557_c0_g4_i2:239-1162(+)